MVLSLRFKRQDAAQLTAPRGVRFAAKLAILGLPKRTNAMATKTPIMKKTDAYSALVRSPSIDAEMYVVSAPVTCRNGQKMTADDLATTAAFPPAELEGALPSNPEDEAHPRGRALGAKRLAKRGAKNASKRAA